MDLEYLLTKILQQRQPIYFVKNQRYWFINKNFRRKIYLELQSLLVNIKETFKQVTTNKHETSLNEFKNKQHKSCQKIWGKWYVEFHQNLPLPSKRQT